MSQSFRFVVFVFLFSFFFGCAQKKDSAKETNLIASPILKINGVSLVASRDALLPENIIPLKEIHANYAAVMPFAFLENTNHPALVYNQQRQWFGETIEGVRQQVKLLHKNGIEVMLKPQIWVWHGEFTGLIKMESEENWLLLEKTYSNFILDFAKVAEEENVGIFCIGTELESFIEHRPQYWQGLIAEVKNIYHGKLTYAANWDEYKRVPFWEALDYVGIDAYFPISESKTSTIGQALEGWKQWNSELKSFSEEKNKKILFTEYGYRSVDFAGKNPWISNREMTSVNVSAQANLLHGLYQSVWEENWFAGGFLWKWFSDHKQAGGVENSQFSPQNKAAEKVVEKQYSKE